MSEELTAEEINQHFSAMDDSVNLINDTIADDTQALEMFGSAEEVKLMMKRNTDHLELQPELPVLRIHLGIWQEVVRSFRMCSLQPLQPQ